MVLLASIDEEIFSRDRYKKGQHWHTLEGAFWFKEGEWQYLMYSGGRYEDETYFPWLSKYRNADGTYSISPHYGEALYNYLTAGASAQGNLDVLIGLYSPTLKQYMRR